uniref:Uncharacterized protein n=1 Tax=Eutreptiella gymnastica TaxID=73025 RepID=A0A7S1J4N7_9EUGL
MGSGPQCRIPFPGQTAAHPASLKVFLPYAICPRFCTPLGHFLAHLVKIQESGKQCGRGCEGRYNLGWVESNLGWVGVTPDHSLLSLPLGYHSGGQHFSWLL